MLASEYEVIVCDSSSTDGTEDAMVASAARYNNVRYVNVALNNPAVKRNAGIRAAKADILILMDDDVIPDKSFVDTHVKAQEASTGVVYCGQIRYPKSWIEKSNYFRYRDSRHLGTSRPEIAPSHLPPWMITTMNLSLKRSEIVSQVGYVSEEFMRYGGEDVEFGFRIAASGIKLIYLPEALVDHYESDGSIRKYYRKLYLASRDSAPVLYRLAPEFLPATKGSYLERIYAGSSAYTIFLRLVAWICTHPWTVRLVIGCLEQVDRFHFLYLPSAYRYLTAVATLAGIRDRSRTSQSSQLKGAWFE
jgi:GT2 family glycosyltransferase